MGETMSSQNGRQIHSDEYLISTLQLLEGDLERPPTVNDVRLLADVLPDLSTYERRYGSYKNALAKAGIVSRYGMPAELILAELRDFMLELGRDPTKAEINANKSIVSAATLCNRFGSVSVALTLAMELPVDDSRA